MIQNNLFGFAAQPNKWRKQWSTYLMLTKKKTFLLTKKKTFIFDDLRICPKLLYRVSEACWSRISTSFSHAVTKTATKSFRKSESWKTGILLQQFIFIRISPKLVRMIRQPIWRERFFYFRMRTKKFTKNLVLILWHFSSHAENF